MFRKSLSHFSVVALAGMSLVLGAAKGCGGTEGPSTFTLESGTYELQPEAYDPNTCWPDDSFPPLVNLPVKLTVNGDGTVLIEGEGLSAGVLPTIEGTVDGNALEAGPESFEVDATDEEEADEDYAGTDGDGQGNCVLIFEATAEGTLTKNNEFDATLPINLSEKTEGGCSELAGDQLDLQIPVPFPELGGGPCNFTAKGHAVKQAD